MTIQRSLLDFPLSSAASAPRPAAVATPQPHLGFCLLDRFAEFSTAMLQSKRQILAGSAAASSAGTDAANAQPRLLALLQAQAAAAEKAEAGASYAEVQLLSAAFVDEVFLDLVWPGSAAWAAEPLEHVLFGTNRGRESVFEHLDALLDRGVATDLDLAKTYLLALALGFRGRYRGREEASHLAAYRERLYRGIYQTEPGSLADGGRLFPDAYLATYTQGSPRKLPSLRGWLALVLSGLLLYGIYSYRLWDQATAGLRAAVAKVLALP